MFFSSVFYLFLCVCVTCFSYFLSSQHLLILYVFVPHKLNDGKKIPFTRDMVKKIFNVPSGSRPIEFGKRGKAHFREVYLGGGDRAPIATAVSVLSKADDDDTIERSWVLLCLALVLAPGTGNMVPLDYLYTLRDMSMVHEFEWDEHILCDVMREVKKYQDNRNEGRGKFLIGGCIPMLLVHPL